MPVSARTAVALVAVVPLVVPPVVVAVPPRQAVVVAGMAVLVLEVLARVLLWTMECLKPCPGTRDSNVSDFFTFISSP